MLLSYVLSSQTTYLIIQYKCKADYSSQCSMTPGDGNVAWTLLGSCTAAPTVSPTSPPTPATTYIGYPNCPQAFDTSLQTEYLGGELVESARNVYEVRK